MLIIGLQIASLNSRVGDAVSARFLSTDDDLEVLRLLFVMMSIADSVPAISRVVHSLFHALHEILMFVFVIIAYQIVFALLGLELFGNLMDHVQEDHAAGTNDAWSGLSTGDQSINFKTFGGAFNLVMVIFGINMAPTYMHWYQDQMEYAKKPLLRRFGSFVVGVYFIGLLMYQYMFVINSMTAVFLNAFESHKQQFKDQSGRVARVIADLQESADRIALGKYTVIQKSNYGDLHRNVLLDDEIRGDTLLN